MQNRTTIAEAGLPEGPRGTGVAQTLSWMYRPIKFVERAREEHGPVFTVRLGPDRNVVVVAEPGLADQVIRGNPEVFRAGDANGIVRPVVGPKSLLVLDSPEHAVHRRILAPAFGGAHADTFGRQVREIADRRISRWKPGAEISMLDEMEAISFEAILAVVFGPAGPDEPPELPELRRLLPEMMRRCASPFTILPYFRRELGGITPYARLRRLLDRLDGIFGEAIARRRDSAEDPSVLSLLVRATGEDGRPLPDSEIRDELLTMIMAGYETTTAALAWTFERLIRSAHSLERAAEAAKAEETEYLDAVAKEALRIRPVVPVVARKVNREVELGPHTIPAGTVLMASIYLLHHDPALHRDPEEFRPNRFLGAREEAEPWLPFGGGVRRCLGASFAQLEMRVVLQRVLSQVALSATHSEPEPIARRRFTFAPGRGARTLVERATS